MNFIILWLCATTLIKDFGVFSKEVEEFEFRKTPKALAQTRSRQEVFLDGETSSLIPKFVGVPPSSDRFPDQHNPHLNHRSHANRPVIYESERNNGSPNPLPPNPYPFNRGIPPNIPSYPVEPQAVNYPPTLGYYPAFNNHNFQGFPSSLPPYSVYPHNPYNSYMGFGSPYGRPITPSYFHNPHSFPNVPYSLYFQQRPYTPQPFNYNTNYRILG